MVNRKVMNVEMKRKTFSSQLGFMLATIGFSVGVGTIWRFPYICGKYGGGLFLLTYILMMIIIGIPLFSAEVSMGLATRQTPVGAYKKIAPKKSWHIVGWFHMICIIMIIGYTAPVYAWIIHYVYATLFGIFDGMKSSEIINYFEVFISNKSLVFSLFLVNTLVTMMVVRNDLQSGLEKISKILLPILTVIIATLIIVGLRLEGGMEGLKFFFTINFESFSIEGVLVALGQTFFSLGIAMAVAMIFGSYQNQDKLNVIKNSTIVVFSTIIVAIASGMMIFPMASAFGVEMSAGSELTFITMPNIFNQMLKGRLWGTIFYIGFYIAAFSSGVAGWEAVISFFMEQFNITRRKGLFTTFIAVCLISVPSILSGFMFNLFDMLVNNLFLISGAFAMSVFIGWFWGIDNMAKTCNIEKNTLGYYFLKLTVKYASPIIVFILSLSFFKVI
ncbi:MAG: sodium-dependent transporter [Tissierellales bacterium]|nr:sodium-dependent transporter [Tissierellales bacterium]